MHLSPLVYDSAVEEGIRPLEQVVQCRSTPHHSYDNLSNRIMSPPLSPALSSSHVSSTSCSEVKTATTKTTVTTSTTTTTTYSATTTSSSPQHLRPDILPRASPNPTINSTTEIPCDRGYNNANHENRERLCNYLPDSQILNKGRKRSFQDEEEADDKREQLERYKKLLMIKKRLIVNVNHQKKVPLFYLYGDLLLIPKYKWGSGVGSGSGRRRTSLGEPDLSTPIDSNTNLEASSQSHPRPENPSLVQVCPDSQTLEEGGFSPERFADVMQPLLNDLNKYGVCVVDDFLGRERAEQILEEVMALYSRGVFQDGQVVSRNVQDQARGIIRGDKITWVTGNENHCGNIGQLVSVVDTLIAKANHHPDSGELGKHNITLRTRAMVACYPGRGSHYVKHVDNPDGDGRCITAIYYINKNWQRKDGGVLRIYPEGTNQVADVEPKFDRMLFFWSDRRNPHEVLPATVTSRYAITVWYLDQSERERYIARVSRGIANT